MDAEEAIASARRIAASYRSRDFDTLESEGVQVWVNNPDLDDALILHKMKMAMLDILRRDKAAFRCRDPGVSCLHVDDDSALDYLTGGCALEEGITFEETLNKMCEDPLDRVIALALMRGHTYVEIAKSAPTLSKFLIRKRVSAMKERYHD